MGAPAYFPFGVALSEGQKEALGRAARDGTSITLRLPLRSLEGPDKLGLTQRQIAHITKKKGEGAGAELTFSKTQLAKTAKMGGFLPLLSLIPMILGGLGAAGALTGGIASAVQSKKATDAANVANAEAARHNREVEAQLKGSGLFLGPSGDGLFLGRSPPVSGGCYPKCHQTVKGAGPRVTRPSKK